MKRRFAFLLALTLSGVLLACTTKESSKQPVTQEDVKRDTQRALETTQAYTQQKKEQYQRKIEAELDELQRQTDDLRARAERARGKAKATLDDQLADLQQKQVAARHKLEELKAAGEPAWEKLQRGLDDAVGEAKRAYERAVARIKP